MGVYTELVLKANVKDNLSGEVEAVLQWLFNGEDKPSNLPNHKFFTFPRSGAVGNCSSYYHIPWATSKYAEGYIFSRSDFKNYSDELETFVDWLRPYLHGCTGQCIGWEWHEESESPTLILLK